MSTTTRLTKKQRKGIAFRERKNRQLGTLGAEAIENEDTVDDEPAAAATMSKRKRPDLPADAELELEDQEQQSRKRLKHDISLSVGEHESIPKQASVDLNMRGDEAASRYILFVGNLRYSTSKTAILEHFSSCDPPPEVRLMTQKGSNKSKGCAFLEFSHNNALRQGLKLHHTQLDGRQINVELTAGGGGKSAARMEKLKHRNANLEQQRQRQASREKSRQLSDASKNDSKEKAPSGKGISRIGHSRATGHQSGATRKKSKTGATTNRPSYRPTGSNALPIG